MVEGLCGELPHEANAENYPVIFFKWTTSMIHLPPFSVSALQIRQKVAGWNFLLSSNPYLQEINLIMTTQPKAPHLTCRQYPAGTSTEWTLTWRSRKCFWPGHGHGAAWWRSEKSIYPGMDTCLLSWSFDLGGKALCYIKGLLGGHVQ